ncbi:MAG: NUDIX domain-containing protein, partial [Anaerolineales bacterium]
MSYLEQLRGRVGARKVIVCYATALIRDARGQLLFQQRGDFDWWGLPGGVLELGETLAECCIREAREETGLHVEPVKLVGVYTGPQYDVRYPNGDEVQQWTAAFECRLVGGEPRADGAESLRQAFFPAQALPATSHWYADMARDLFATRGAAFFEPPRHPPPSADGAHRFQLRSLVGQAELIAPGAGAFIRDERGHLLLIRRADNGMWSVPAGMMDLGENIAETVVRETREETGLIVEPTRLIGAYSGPEYRIV